MTQIVFPTSLTGYEMAEFERTSLGAILARSRLVWATIAFTIGFGLGVLFA